MNLLSTRSQERTPFCGNMSSWYVELDYLESSFDPLEVVDWTPHSGRLPTSRPDEKSPLSNTGGCSKEFDFNSTTSISSNPCQAASEKVNFNSLASSGVGAETIDPDIVQKTLLDKSSGRFPSLLSSQCSNPGSRQTFCQNYEICSTLTPKKPVMSTTPAPPVPPAMGEENQEMQPRTVDPEAAPSNSFKKIKKQKEGKKIKKQPKKKKRSSTKRKPEPEKREYVELTNSDVICARGGEANRHPGNKNYLMRRNQLKPHYSREGISDEEKTRISEVLVASVRFFVKLDEELGKYYKIHPRAARVKASQALRDPSTKEERQEKRKKWPSKRKKTKKMATKNKN